MSHEAAEKPKQRRSADTQGHTDTRQRVAETQRARLTPPIVATHYFGEQVIGSNETWAAQMPWNLDGAHAIVEVWVDGAGFVLESTPKHTLPSSRSSEARAMEYLNPVVAFRPSKRGDHRGVLSIRSTWPDGHVELQRIALRGAARALDDVPQRQITDEERATAEREEAARRKSDAEQEAAVAREAQRTDPLPNNVDDAFDGVDGYVNAAKDAAAGLAAAQSRGLTQAKDEAMSYVRKLPPVPRNYALDLVELGLTLATGGIAKAVGSALVGLMKQDASEGFGKFLANTVSSGLETAGKSAIAAGKRAATPESVSRGGAGGEEEEHAHSPNQRIDFFIQQQAILDAQIAANRAFVVNQARFARPRLRIDPASVERTFKALGAAMRDNHKPAADLQASSTAAAWTTLVARMRLGTKQTATGVATRLDDARPSATRNPGRIDGVLDLVVSATSNPRILSARLDGVAAEIVDHIRMTALSSLAVPIRVVYGPSLHAPAIITRDEAGRVRVSGNLDAIHAFVGTPAALGEASAIAAATSLLARVLGDQSLKALGIAVAHDDATAFGDTQEGR